MSDTSMNGVVPVNPMLVLNQLFRAIEHAATFAAGSSDAREIQECGQAALTFAQAVTTLDPNRLQGGDTPQARVAAAPPRPTPNLPQRRDKNHNGVVGQ